MFTGLANGVAALTGAGLASQFPAYYAQYVQRLGGNLDHARVGVGRITAAADALGMGIDELLAKFLTNADATFRTLGELHLQTVADVDRLSAAETALKTASPLQRPFALAQHFDRAIADGAWRAFEPALPLSLEGLIYAAIGMAAGLLALTGARAASRLWSRRSAGAVTE